MFIMGMVRILLDIMVRAIVVARVLGCLFWMFGALWDTALQVAASLIRLAVEKKKEVKALAASRTRWRQGRHTLEQPEGLNHLTTWRP
jgi:hypothetical protein